MPVPTISGTTGPQLPNTRIIYSPSNDKPFTAMSHSSSAVVRVIGIHYSPVVGHFIKNARDKLRHIHGVSFGVHHKWMLKKLSVLGARTLILDEAGKERPFMHFKI